MPSLRGRKLCVHKDYSKAINPGMKNQARRKALKIIARLYRHTKKERKKKVMDKKPIFVMMMLLSV